MKETIKTDISIDLDDNLKYIKNLFKDNSDIIFREFYIGKYKAFLMYIDGMGDKILLNDFILETLMIEKDEIKGIRDIKDKILTVTDIREENNLSKAINSVLSGDTILAIETMASCFVIASRLWPVRGVSEPSGETTIRGGRDGFVETLRFNTALVRRRVKDTRFKIISKIFGARSKTDTVVMYIEDIVNKDVLNKLNKRLDRIDIDAVLDSGYIEQLIEDNKWSIFPQVQSTERPDVVAAAIYEGRVAIIVDNSPFALIVPATLANLLQSPDDYYQKWMYGSLVRIIRTISIFISLTLPALYVAITSFHPQIIPTKLAFSIAASREGVPFPAFVEVLLMEALFAFLIEAVVRLPKPIGMTIGIVGGLIIGQAAVESHIVSQIIVIIVSLTAITTFMTSDYGLTISIRIIRFLLIITASFMGLFGIMIGLIVVTINLINLKSFGIPYLAPLTNPNIKDFKDMFIRSPLKYFKRRPSYMKTQDKTRQK